MSGGRQRIARQTANSASGCKTANSASGCIGSTYSTMPCCFSRPPQTPTPSGHKSVLHRSFFRHIFPVHQHFACPHLRETSSVVALPWIGATLARGEGLGGLHGQTVREASREAHMHNHSQLIHNSPPPGVFGAKFRAFPGPSSSVPASWFRSARRTWMRHLPLLW